MPDNAESAGQGDLPPSHSIKRPRYRPPSEFAPFEIRPDAFDRPIGLRQEALDRQRGWRGQHR
jgi:hypothetical protein